MSWSASCHLKNPLRFHFMLQLLVGTVALFIFFNLQKEKRKKSSKPNPNWCPGLGRELRIQDSVIAGKLNRGQKVQSNSIQLHHIIFCLLRRYWYGFLHMYIFESDYTTIPMRRWTIFPLFLFSTCCIALNQMRLQFRCSSNDLFSMSLIDAVQPWTMAPSFHCKNYSHLAVIAHIIFIIVTR